METTLGSVKTIVDRVVCSSLKIIDEHKQTNDKMMEKNLEAVNEVLEEKKFYEQKTKELQLYCEILKEQKDYFHKHLEAAKVEMEYAPVTRYLYQREKTLLLSLTGGEDILSKQDSEYYQKRQENLASIGKFLKSLTTDFSSAIKHLSEKHASDKHELIKMEKHLRSMMIGEKTTKECQVNELELKWGVENVANLDVIQNEFFDNSVKLHGTGISFDSSAHKLRANDNLERLELESELELRAKVPAVDSGRLRN